MCKVEYYTYGSVVEMHANVVFVSLFVQLSEFNLCSRMALYEIYLVLVVVGRTTALKTGSASRISPKWPIFNSWYLFLNTIVFDMNTTE